jgi:3',5'-cyclic AMP phosphodiesterase CpdA
LIGSAASVAAAAWGRAEEPADAGQDWALISDTHVAADRKAGKDGVVMAENFARAASMICESPHRPKGIVLNGDCVFLRGLQADYSTLADLLGMFHKAEAPLHLLLGNHDDRANFRAGLGKQSASNAPADVDRVASVLETAWANWFLLDSLEVVNQTPGLIGERQRAWLSNALDARKDKPAIIMAHHNLSGVERLRREAKSIIEPTGKRLPIPGLKDTTPMLDLLAAKPNVVAYLCGHTHQWNVLQWKHIHLVNLPPVAYTFTREDPNGWVRCRLSSKGLRVELVPFDSKHPANGQAVDVPWRTT